MAVEVQDRNSYSEGNQITFCDGKAWGVAPDLSTIYLGKETDILDALKNNKLTGNKTVDNILTMEINSRGRVCLPTRATAGRHQINNKRHGG